MGLFLVTMAIAIVVVQATLILSNREPNLWVFQLLDSQVSNNISIQNNHSLNPFEECEQKVLNKGEINIDHCRLWYHNTHEISTIFNNATWNPHILLLVLSCIHLIVCFSNAKEHYIESLQSDTVNAFLTSRVYKLPSSLCLCILILLCMVVGLVSSNRNLSLVPSQQRLSILDSPTIIVSVILFIASAWFLKIHNEYCKNPSSEAMKTFRLWALIFQLQIIGVPLTVLMIAVMGARIFIDILTHFLFLSVAVNTLWLQNNGRSQENDNLIITFTRLITVGIPLYCILIAQSQWGGNDNWQHISVFMSFISMAPLFLSPFFNAQELISTEGNKKTTKHNKWIYMRLGSYCSTAALGCTVINLALL